MIYTKDKPKLIKNIFAFKAMTNFTGVVKDQENNIAYYLNGKFHRENGPAIEFATGSKSWYLNGKRHRTDGPACEYVSGTIHWYLNDEYHGYDDDFTNKSWIRFVELQVLK